jgi:hypothetical protein
MKVETKAELRRIVKVSSERISELEKQLIAAIDDEKQSKNKLIVSIICNVILAILLALRFRLVGA